MPLQSFTLLLFLMLVSYASPHFHQPASSQSDAKNETAEAAVARVESEWLKSIENRDADAMAEVLADDFVRPDPRSGQFVTKADVLSYFRSKLMPQNANPKEIQGLSVSVYGSSAIARGTLVTTDPSGHVVSKLLFTDIFVQRAGKWLAVSAQENEVGQH